MAPLISKNPIPESEQKELPKVIQDLLSHLHSPNNTDNDNNNNNNSSTTLALPVAAMKTLLGVIRTTQAHTMMGLQDELRQASNEMLEFATSSTYSHSLLGGRSPIALQSGCELFMKYVTRTFLELPSFQDCISQVLERAETFANISLTARSKIANVGHSFIQDGATVLTHGYSRVVMDVLLKAALYWNKQFSLIILEGRPDAGGVKMAQQMYEKAGIPTTVVLDAAMGYVMERHVDLVIVGAEGVVENGGIVNKIGTYGLGICAKELNKPFYVAVESYKFARLFPLNQADLPDMNKVITIHRNNNKNTEGREVLCGGDDLTFIDTVNWKTNIHLDDNHDDDNKPNINIPGLVQLPDPIKVENPPCDYTPAKYITLLFTDLGVFTPSAVSDELIRLYQ